MNKFVKLYEFEEEQVLVHKIYQNSDKEDEFEEYLMQVITEINGKKYIQNLSINKKSLMDDVFENFNRIAARDFLNTVKQSVSKGDTDAINN